MIPAVPTVVGGVGEIDRVNAFGQVVERDFVGGMPASTVYGGLPAYGGLPQVVAPTIGGTTVLGGGAYGVGEIDRVNAFGQVVERDFVGGVPSFAGGFPRSTVLPGTTVAAAPTMVAPTTAMGPFGPTVVGGVGEIDRVNAFGQVVERDFVGGVPGVYGGLPTSTVVGGVPPVYGGLPTSVYGGVPPVYGGVPPVYGGVPPVYGGVAAPRVVSAAPSYAPATTVAGPFGPTVVGGVGEIDRVNAFGQVVERDFVGGVPGVYGAPFTTGFPTTVAPPAVYGGFPTAPTVVSGSYAPPVVGAPFVSGSYTSPVVAAPQVYSAPQVVAPAAYNPYNSLVL